MKRSGRGPLARWAVASLLVAWLAGGDALASPLYGLVDRGDVYVSTDDGVSWSGETTLATSMAVGLVAGPAPGDRTLLTRDGTVWRSTGGPWSAIGTIDASDLRDLAVGADGSLWTITATGIVHGSSDGVLWSAAAALPTSDATSITIDRAGRIYVLGRRGTVWRDDGDGYVAVAALPLSDARAIRARFDVLRILDATGWVLGSDDAGSAWQTLGTLSQVGSVDLAPTTAGWAAMTSTGDLATSSDGGTWTWVGTLSQVGVVGLASGWSLVTAVEAGSFGPTLRLGAPYPNPAPSGATLVLPLRDSVVRDARLEVFDARGRRLTDLRLGSIDDGDLRWTGPSLASGVYHLRVSDARGRRATARWVIVD